MNNKFLSLLLPRGNWVMLEGYVRDLGNATNVELNSALHLHQYKSKITPLTELKFELDLSRVRRQQAETHSASRIHGCNWHPSSWNWFWTCGPHAFWSRDTAKQRMRMSHNELDWDEPAYFILYGHAAEHNLTGTNSGSSGGKNSFAQLFFKTHFFTSYL